MEICDGGIDNDCDTIADDDDDSVDTRRLGCAVIDALLVKLGPKRLEHERMRKLYPELLKRLDDASDEVRTRACAPLASFFRCMNYSAIWTEAHNFDKTNYQYLLRGLLVHLDDPSPEIQSAIASVFETGMHVDPLVFAQEVVAVRERHRSPKDGTSEDADHAKRPSDVRIV